MREIKNIKVTIIMATYNRGHLISETLKTVQNQSYPSWECIVIDDGSEDKTEQIISGFKNHDSRIKYLKRGQEYRKGLPGSRNFGLDHAKGDYIIFFDDDDIVHPQNLETCISVLEKESGFFCRYDKRPFKTEETIKIVEVTDVQSSHFNIDDIDKMITGEIPFASCGVMWRKECFEKIRFNEDLMYAEEWECYSRILLEGFTGASINQILYFNRKHLKSNTGEFYNKHPTRRESYIKAVKLVIERLAEKSLISPKLEIFFIRLGFFLKDYSVISYTLRKADAGRTKRFKYLTGFYFYPLIRPFFIMRKKINDHLS